MHHNFPPLLRSLPALLLVLLVNPLQLRAQSGEEIGCTNAHLRGWYGGGGSGFEIQAPTGDVGNFPTANTIMFYADGEGAISTFKLLSSTHGPEPLGFVAQSIDLAATAVSGIEYSIDPDCRGRIALMEPQFGPVLLGIVLVNGGREGWAVRLRPAGVISIAFRRVEALEQELEMKADTLSAKIDVIMRWLGIPPLK